MNFSPGQIDEIVRDLVVEGERMLLLEKETGRTVLVPARLRLEEKRQVVETFCRFCNRLSTVTVAFAPDKRP